MSQGRSRRSREALPEVAEALEVLGAGAGLGSHRGAAMGSRDSTVRSLRHAARATLSMRGSGRENATTDARPNRLVGRIEPHVCARTDLRGPHKLRGPAR